ncbi:MAG: amino acid ABC transporter permease [Ruminococcaceae bacterium]|nr:amino acid ABC transporter permease [Oscillospiraceae bacterium]
MTFWQVTLYLLNGFSLTLLLFLLTLIFALPLGLAISFASMSKFKPLSFLSKIFVWIIRGVPLMLQIMIVYYVPNFLGFKLFSDIDLIVQLNFGLENMGRFIAVTIAFIINYACYFSEIYRGGIESIPQGQYEAGQVLGLTKSQIFKKIVLKQVIKRILPPMGNEVITLVKDTSLANVLTVGEIIYQSKLLMAEALIWPMFYAGVFYLIFVGLLTILLGKLEKKLSYFKA